MGLKLGIAGLVLGVAAWSSWAGASGDVGCGPKWTLDAQTLECGSRIVIGPGNDTRVNLLLLLRDRDGLDGQGLAYPAPEWPDYGRTFLDWDVLLETVDPREPVSPDDGDYETYYGSRCQTVRTGGEQFLAAAARNRRIGAGDRALLAQGRQRILGLCEGGYASDDAGQSLAGFDLPHTYASVEAREFGTYMAGAAAFYLGDWRAARERFAALRTASDDWVRESALYMSARSELGASAATASDEWGYFNADAADKDLADRAARSFSAYLDAYPRGSYAASATGLLRRAYWLAGDVGKQGTAYASMLGSVDAESEAAYDLIDEIDNKLLFREGSERAIDSPVLLAVMDLVRMRAGTNPEDEPWVYGTHGLPPLTAEELAKQEAAFAVQPALYEVLQANFAYYVAKDYRAVLRLLPVDARQPAYSPLGFSRQALRGMALAALQDRNEAGFWIELLGGAKGVFQRPTAELGLALAWERANEVAKAFAPDSPIEDARIREILIERSAGPDVLRTVAGGSARSPKERDLAAYVLIYRELSRGRYADALRDLPLARADGPVSDYSQESYEPQVPVGVYARGRVSDGYACPALAETIGRLARDETDVRGRLCLGEFYRLNGFDSHYLDQPVEGDVLGSHVSFPGAAIPRSQFYNAIIAEPGVSREERAYALYRALRCYAPAGNSSCGGEEVPETQRRAWFQRLKREFAQTRWARETEYYW